MTSKDWYAIKHNHIQLVKRKTNIQRIQILEFDVIKSPSGGPWTTIWKPQFEVEDPTKVKEPSLTKYFIPS